LSFHLQFFISSFKRSYTFKFEFLTSVKRICTYRGQIHFKNWKPIFVRNMTEWRQWQLLKQLFTSILHPNETITITFKWNDHYYIQMKRSLLHPNETITITSKWSDHIRGTANNKTIPMCVVSLLNKNILSTCRRNCLFKAQNIIVFNFSPSIYTIWYHI
jgi:hypothetical protein